MNKKIRITNALILMSFILIMHSCKPDCEKGEITTQDYKIYQSWYPYQETDTLHFYRPIENDTLTFFGEKYKYPFYKRVGACDCCDDVNNEYLQQGFKSANGEYYFRVEMDGANIKFIMFNSYRYSYNFDIAGHELLFEEVVTPDSIYANANRLNSEGQSCYYTRKIGLVKYRLDSVNTWLFLRYKK